MKPIRFSTKVSLVTLALFMIITLFINAYFFVETKTLLQTYISSQLIDHALVLKTELTYNLSRKFDASELLARDSSIIQFASKSRYINTTNSLLVIDGYTEVRQLLRTYTEKDNSISSISLFLKQRGTLLYDDGFQLDHISISDPIYTAYANTITSNQTTFSSNYIDSASGDYTYSIQTPIHVGEDIIGILSINFALDDVVNNLSHHEYLLLNHDLEPLIQTKNDLIDLAHLSVELRSHLTESTYSQADDIIIHYQFIPEYNWYLVNFINQRTLLKPFLSSIILSHLTIITVIVGISILLLMWIRHFFKPFGALQNGIHKVAAGDFTYAIANESNDELGESIHAFNRMRTSLSSVIVKIFKSIRTIHASTSVLADDTSRGSQAVDAISNIVQKISHDAGMQLDEIQNARYLSKAFSSKLDNMMYRSSELSSKTGISEETMISAHGLITDVLQRTTVFELAIRTLLLTFDTFYAYINDLTLTQDAMVDLQKELMKSNQAPLAVKQEVTLLTTRITFISSQLQSMILNLEMGIDNLRELSIELQDFIQEILTHCETVSDLLLDAGNQYVTLVESLEIILTHSQSIEKSLDVIIKLSQSTTNASDEVASAIHNHTLAMKNIEHQITTLYKSSIDLTNEISKFKLSEQETL